MPKFNEVILKLTESGILDKWLVLQIHDMGLLNTNSSLTTNITINVKRSFDKIQADTDELISLGVAHVGGAFLVLFMGCGLAFAVFIIEISMHKYLLIH